MNRIIQHFYPEIIFDGSQKWLFNPILKKRYKILPEERVRLQWVDYILQNKIWTKGRIGFETPVKAASQDGVLRADLVLYNEEMKPEVLIECKADTVSLNYSTAEQAARYNSKLGAKHIILTNGASHQAFKFEDGVPQRSDLPFQTPAGTHRKIAYWQKRGFCSSSLNPELESWLENQLQSFSPGSSEAAKIRYLNFKSSFIPIPMDHYYQIIPLKEAEQIAYTFLGFPRSDTFAVFVLNKKGKNKALAVLNMSSLFSGNTPEIQVISSGYDEITTITASDFETLREADPILLVKFIRKFFD